MTSISSLTGENHYISPGPSQETGHSITELIITDSKAMLALSPLPDLIIFAGLTVLTRVCRGWARRPTLGGEFPGTAG